MLIGVEQLEGLILRKSALGTSRPSGRQTVRSSIRLSRLTLG
jgi:hypothetical protein